MRHPFGSGSPLREKVGGPSIYGAGIVPAAPALAVLLIGGALVTGCGKADPRADLEPKVQRYVEMWNRAEFEGIEELLTEDFELLESPGFEPSSGVENFKQAVLAYHRSYPDFHITVDEAIYGSESVAMIWTVRATNSGAGPRPPTGKRVEVTGMSVIHFRDDRIRDEWIAGNDFEWYRQLGYEMIPAGGAGSR